MPQREDLTGQRFGRLTVISFNGIGNRRKSMWNCLCDCGNEKVVPLGNLKNGHTKSCGCYNIEKILERAFTHRLSGTPEHRAWGAMIQRCTNPNDKGFFNWGMRGIEVCERWLHSFENFLEDMGNRPSKNHTLDRIDNDGNYCKENCRWATPKEQARNRRTNVWYEYNGKRMIAMDWAIELGIHRTTLERNIKKYPFEKIVEKFQKI
jgi:hypothetical protein